MALLALLHIALLLAVLGEIHRSPLWGWFVLTFWWFSLLACAAALFRLAGRWCYWLVGIGSQDLCAGPEAP